MKYLEMDKENNVPELCGIKINCFKGITFKFDDKLKLVTTLNVEILLRTLEDKYLKKIIDNSLVTIDGKWIYWAIRRKYGNKFNLVKISGSDLIFKLPFIVKKANKKLLLLGSTYESNKLAVKKLRKISKYDLIYGFSPKFSSYPFTQSFISSIKRIIAEISPDVIVTAFGVPKQEYWAWENREFLQSCGVNYVLFLGGAINMVAGKEKKAPKWISEIGLESIYRLLNNPKRFKRFLKQLKFIPLLISNKL